MLNYKLPIHLTGLAVAFFAGVAFVAPVQAQSSDDDSTYSSRGGYRDDVYSSRGSDGNDVKPDDDTDNDVDTGDTDDNAQAGVADSDRDGDDQSADDGQNYARSEEENRCIAEFRSFDPATGMYVTEDGDRERCPYLF